MPEIRENVEEKAAEMFDTFEIEEAKEKLFNWKDVGVFGAGAAAGAVTVKVVPPVAKKVGTGAKKVWGKVTGLFSKKSKDDEEETEETSEEKGEDTTEESEGKSEKKGKKKKNKKK